VNTNKLIYEFFHILKPGGKIIITAPLGSGIHQEPYHFYGGYTPFWYEEFLDEAGFECIHIEGNTGSLRACAQESMRFMQLSKPFSLGMPLWKEQLWLVCWLILLPFMAVAAPMASYLFDRYDKDRRFTIGYHVTAVRKTDTE